MSYDNWKTRSPDEPFEYPCKWVFVEDGDFEYCKHCGAYGADACKYDEDDELRWRTETGL